MIKLWRGRERCKELMKTMRRPTIVMLKRKVDTTIVGVKNQNGAVLYMCEIPYNVAFEWANAVALYYALGELDI